MKTPITMNTAPAITLATARKVLATVDAGLCRGVGQPIPGQMCVEAAVCYALGQPHGDEPACVAPSVRAFKIRLNDSAWSSNAARAAGMRGIAIAQLGTAGAIDEKEFVRILAKLTIQRIVPLALRAAAGVNGNEAFKDRLEAAAVVCETDGTHASAVAARAVAGEARYAAYAYAAAAAAADVADGDARPRRRDGVLAVAAALGVEALRQVGAPGVALMDQLIPRE